LVEELRTGGNEPLALRRAPDLLGPWEGLLGRAFEVCEINEMNILQVETGCNK
jgi:hypothetical protein